MATPAKHVLSEFKFPDNQLQKVLSDVRFAIHQLQGLDGSNERVLTTVDVPAGATALNNGLVEEAPTDGKDYSRNNGLWNYVLGVQGTGTDRVFHENDHTVSQDYTVSNRNALSVGPITVDATVTVDAGSVWVVI